MSRALDLEYAHMGRCAVLRFGSKIAASAIDLNIDLDLHRDIMAATTSCVLRCGVVSAHSSSSSYSGYARTEYMSCSGIPHPPARPSAEFEVVVDNLPHLPNPVPYPHMISCVQMRDIDFPGIKWQPELSVASFEVWRSVSVVVRASRRGHGEGVDLPCRCRRTSRCGCGGG